MPVRLRIHAKRVLQQPPTPGKQYVCLQCRHASLATASANNPPPIDPIISTSKPIARYPPQQPPSYKRPEFRKSQLHRQYQSLLRSTPLMVIFQHNNLRATEWMGIRRELAAALRKTDEEQQKLITSNTAQSSITIGAETKLHTIQTGIFASALKITELHNDLGRQQQQGPTSSSTPLQRASHGLSRESWSKARSANLSTGLEPLLSGPLAVLTFPSVSPMHLKTALSILSPGKDFPAPKRRAAPGYFEPQVQSGLQKLMLLAARVDGRVFDNSGIRGIGAIEGGLDGLRAQLVALLMGAGMGVTNTLEAAGRGLWLTLEGRRGMLEEEDGKSAEKQT